MEVRDALFGATAGSQRTTARGSLRRGDGVRLGVALLVSLFLHGLPVWTGLLGRLVLRHLPKPPIEFVLLPPKARAAQPPAATMQPTETRPPAPTPGSVPPKPPTPGDGQKPAKPPGAQLPKQSLAGVGLSALDHDFGVRVLLRPPLLRASPHRDNVLAFLGAFPDTHILSAGTALGSGPAMAKAIVDDVDALLIATTNIHNLTSTVMYARPRPGSTLLETLSARRKLGWDPRQVQAQRADLWSFARPELLGPGSTPEEGGGTRGGETLPMWLDRLAGALKQPGPALYAECVNIHKGMALQGELPTPQSLRLVLTADADPLLSAQIRFLSKEDAARAAAALPALRSKVSGQLFWLGLGGLLANLTFVTQDAVMEVKGRFSRGDVTVLMVWVKSWMPPPERIPGLVPPPPPPPQGLDGGIGPDAGAGITP